MIRLFGRGIRKKPAGGLENFGPGDPLSGPVKSKERAIILLVKYTYLWKSTLNIYSTVHAGF